MKKISILSLFVLLVALATVGVVSAVSSQHYEAHLTSTGEPFPVVSDAVGQAVFRVADDGQSIEYRLIVANLEDTIMSHIHYGVEGSAGPISVWLYPDRPPLRLIPGFFNGVLMTGTITQADLDALKPAVGPDTRPIQTMEQLLTAMAEGKTYVNVHTVEYGAGEIRGQIK